MMGGNTIAGSIPVARIDETLKAQLKALVWEECRTGGAVASACFAVGLMSLLACRSLFSIDRWEMDAGLIMVYVFFVPALAVPLMILRTDYSGHMVGGFSERILRLPVPVWAAAGVPLIMRAMFVFLSTLILCALFHLLYGGGPSIAVAPAFTLVYLAAQTIDWLRGPIAGVKSAVVLTLAALLTSSFVLRDTVEWYASRLFVDPGLWFGALALALPLSYALAIPAVHAARVGRRFGSYELWTLPTVALRRWPVREKAFATPLGAQIWLEWRRSFWIMPVTTMLVWGLMVLALYFAAQADGGLHADDRQAFLESVSVQILLSMLIGAAAHGIATRIMGIRSRSQHLAYEIFQPLSSAQKAVAKTVANGAILIPVTVFATAAHLLSVEQSMLREVLPMSLERGTTSWREFAWLLIGRGVLAAMLAWPLMAIGTRAARRAVVVAGSCFVAYIYFASVLYWPLAFELAVDSIDIWVGLVWLVLVAPMLWLAVDKRIISRWHALACTMFCLVCTWALYRILELPPEATVSPGQYIATATLTCLGWSAMLLLPYLAFAFDFHRQRHAACPEQDPAQHQNTVPTPLLRILSLAGLAALAWLAWPTDPGYVRYLHKQGVPATLEQAQVLLQQREANTQGQRFLALERLRTQYPMSTWVDYPQRFAPGRQMLASATNLLADYRSLKDKPKYWNAVDAYWNSAAIGVEPFMIGLPESGTGPAIYKSRLRYEGLEMPHLDALGSVVTELRLSVLYHSAGGSTDKALDAVQVILSIADSLESDPFLPSLEARNRFYATACLSIQTLFNHLDLSNAQLTRLDRMIAGSYGLVRTGTQESMALDMGEAIAFLALEGVTHSWEVSVNEDGKSRNATTSLLLKNLAYPPAYNRALLARIFAQARGSAREPLGDLIWPPRTGEKPRPDLYSAMNSQNNLRAGRFRIGSVYFWMKESALWLNVAQTAVAIERFRMETGSLPQALASLTPTYLKDTPKDAYRRNDGLLQYTIDPDGTFTVYSVGRDGRDNNGMTEDGLAIGADLGKDFAIRVPPEASRTQPLAAGVAQ